MKAYWISPGPGGTGVELRETAVPEPKPGEILVRVRATSLNRGELLGGRAGAPAKPGGGECAGEVVKLGDGVTGVSVGDRLMGRCAGCFAEYALMDAREAMRVPARRIGVGRSSTRHAVRSLPSDSTSIWTHSRGPTGGLSRSSRIRRRSCCSVWQRS